LRQTLKTAVTNPVEFAKSRVTGGIGVNLTTDPASALPLIAAVGAGSPADRAGLRAGDLITKVDGLATTNLPPPQLADAIRGFTGGRVTLTILRDGTTNIERVIERSSWNTLRRLSYNPYE
jgi:C-terminal processing protease CtpA/Prc